MYSMKIIGVDKINRWEIEFVQGIEEKNFSLFHSGNGKNDIFFDIDVIACNPSLQKALIEVFLNKIDNLINQGLKFDKIAFIDKECGPVGTILLASSISQILNKEIIILRPWKGLRFQNIKIKGHIKNVNESPLKPNDKILLIDDVIATGASQIKAIELVETFGSNVTGIVCAFVRTDLAVENIKSQKNINFIDKIYTYEELLLLGFIAPNTQELLSMDFMEKLIDDILPEKFDDSELIAFKNLDKSIDDIIDNILIEYKIEADDVIKQALKNLYLSGLSSYVQRCPKQD